MNKPVIEKFKQFKLDFLKVTNNAGMSVIFCNLGSSIFSIKYLGKHMTYQPKFPWDFKRKDVYHGKTIGRVAGRIKDSKIDIDGRVYKLAANEGVNCLHGGKGAISEKLFSYEFRNSKEKTEVIYYFFSRDGEAGFPGDASIEVRYTLWNNKPELNIELTCKVSEKCPISLTTHTYFCLGDKNINDFNLKINSSKYVEMDPVNLIMEKACEIPPYIDFRSKKSLIKDINAKEMNQGMLKGYDHFLLLDESNNKPQISLESKHFKVDISTDFDSVVIYSDNFDPKFRANNSREKIRRGFAIEPQLNVLGNRMLKKNEIFKHFITYEFDKLD